MTAPQTIVERSTVGSDRASTVVFADDASPQADVALAVAEPPSLAGVVARGRDG